MKKIITLVLILTLGGCTANWESYDKLQAVAKEYPNHEIQKIGDGFFHSFILRDKEGRVFVVAVVSTKYGTYGVRFVREIFGPLKND